MSLQIRSWWSDVEVFFTGGEGLARWSNERADAVTFHGMAAAESALLEIKTWPSRVALQAEIVSRPSLLSAGYVRRRFGLSEYALAKMVEAGKFPPPTERGTTLGTSFWLPKTIEDFATQSVPKRRGRPRKQRANV